MDKSIRRASSEPRQNGFFGCHFRARIAENCTLVASVIDLADGRRQRAAKSDALRWGASKLGGKRTGA